MKKIYKFEDKFIRFLLILTWFVLISFGYISIIKPAWLINLSETGKSMEAQQSINKAYEALKNENYKMAVQSYKKALEIQPKMEGAQIGLGVTYSKIGVYNKAISIFKNLLKDKPGNSYAIYYNLAEIHEKTGKIEKAIKYYIKSAESAPSAFYPYGKIGQIYLNKKKWDDAIFYYKKAIENKLDIKTSYLSMLKSSLYEYSDPEIIEKLNEILACGFPPEFHERYYSERFQKVLSEDKNLANINNDIGFAYAMKGEMDIAIIYFRKSIKIWPESERAKQDLKTALEIQDENQIKVR